MIREATPMDAPALERFLAGHAATSMFLRGNLAAHGIGERVHRHGTTYFLDTRNDEVTGVVGVTNGGYLMCQAPAQSGPFWREIAQRLEGRKVEGMTGVPEQTIAFAEALGMDDSRLVVNDVQPLYVLSKLDGLPLNSGFELRRPDLADAAMLAEWFTGYHADTGMKPAQGDTARDLAQDFIKKGDTRIGNIEGNPVAMTAINARASETVQVGGVYVPNAMRGRGYGGAVVAAHLAELAGQGMQKAILFAASALAARAYKRIGFKRIGFYRIALLDAPMVVGAQTGDVSQ